jgi:hypothetical protein
MNKMLTSRFVFSLVAIIMAIFAICKLDLNQQPIIENFPGISTLSVRASPALMNVQTKQVATLDNVAVLPTAMQQQDMMGSGTFFQTANFQSTLPARFNPNGYGAYINYNPPANKNMAVPKNPLTFDTMSKVPGGGAIPSAQDQNCEEGYCGSSCGSGDVSCGKGGYGIGHLIGGDEGPPPGYTNGNYQNTYDELPGDGDGMSSMLPVGNMTATDSLGNDQQYVTFNQYMFAPGTPSRSWGQGDMIRGDLPITPCQNGWFSVYPTISRDLNPGAMNVMGGGGGEANSGLMALLLQSTGGAKSTFGGVDLNDITQETVNMSNQATMNLQSAIGGTVTATSFV